MGNDNSQITFPIEGNNHQNNIKINSKRIKHKEPSNNNNQINLQQKTNHKNQKILKKNYIVPRISTTPDRNINIPGMNKNSINNKRYVSYEKNLKASQNNENKNNFKKNELNIDNKKIVKTKNKLLNNISILYITNLLNNIYSCEIDNKINELHLGTKTLIFNNTNQNHKKDINFMFDSIFRYNYFHKNVIKPIKIKSNSKNKNQNNNNIKNNNNIIPKHFQETIKKQQNETKINNINIKNNIKYIENKNQKMSNIINIKTNKKNINQNTTLVLNKIDIDEEVISVNNKKKNHINLNINNNQINKKYSESRYVTDSESGFISQDEFNLVNNIPQIKDDKIITKEEDASESQTDKQDIIKYNITNKNKINNDNYFNNNNNAEINSKNNNKFISNNINNEEKKVEDKNIGNKLSNINSNIKINSDDTIKSKIMEKDEEIILSNNESQNTTYLEILLAMNENKNESIINDIKNEYINNKNKHLKHKKLQTNKLNENKKQTTPPNIPIKREITPPNTSNKRLTLNMALNKIPKNMNNNANKVINKTKKITPLKKLQININYNGANTKSNFYTKNYVINNNSNFNSNSAIKQANNTINNNVYSPKKIKQNSLSKNKNNNNNFSSNKKLDYKLLDKPKNQNSSPIPILTYNNNINSSRHINNIKNKKNSDSISPSNSPDPSPTNHFNNNYKDRYTYKKMTQINNSLRKKVNETNNISNQYSINASNNNYIQGNDKSSTLYSKINTNNTTKRTNYNNINNKKIFRNSANKNKIIFFKKERLSGNSFNNKIQNTNEIVEIEPRTKSNDQKYSVYNSKMVLATTKKKIK